MSDPKIFDYTKATFSEAENNLLKQETEVIKHKYPNHIPIVVRSQDKSNTLKLSKVKYLVGGDITVGQFLFLLRKRLKGTVNASES